MAKNVMNTAFGSSKIFHHSTKSQTYLQKWLEDTKSQTHCTILLGKLGFSKHMILAKSKTLLTKILE
jgi:hypothetical protein